MLLAKDLQHKSEFRLASSDLDNLNVNFELLDLDVVAEVNEEMYTPFIKVYSYNELFYDTFLKQHMHRNIPCIIKGIASQWPSSLNWVKDIKPNFEYLTDKFGDALVPVANCEDRYYNAQKKEEQTLKQFLNYWKSYISKNYPFELPCYYLKLCLEAVCANYPRLDQIRSLGTQSPTTFELIREHKRYCLTLEHLYYTFEDGLPRCIFFTLDWHFMRDFPDEEIYKVPKFFGSDWLNEYFISREDLKDDYRFVYMGPKGSWTPFHADVFSSFSWSVNICGKKRWVLFPPGQEKCLTDKHGNLVYDIESPILQDASQYKDYHKSVRQYEVIQEAGDAIFVPSGWHHQVWNLEDTISINHNWVNGLNIDKMWASLRANLDAVKKEISDCQDMEGWEEHCQLMLNASYGLDLKQFCHFLLYIVRVRIEHLKKTKKLTLFSGLAEESNHMKLDVFQAKKILVKVLSDPDFVKLNRTLEESEIMRTIKEIDIILDK